ncbi:GDP-mannose 4,6-dehydratase [Candidatus Dojkabacteria bacterium]|uniref:GDP-mannose 4,6-dehydratase n=1 Tax=Candidatus Dojkabacteria bacterium TaxID=2099670 RepID=A0A955L575_9BACT|nr:GDP-mannose 4,6-dehydratase [Candidatus Dojkabacteria bacterium]
MKILVTGGAGFIGSFLARKLLERGDDVVAIDNFNDYYSRRAKEFNLDLIRYSVGDEVQDSESDYIEKVLKKLDEFQNLDRDEISDFGRFEFEELDIRDFDALENLFKKHKFDAVMHLAAMAGVPYSLEKPRLYTEVNIDGTVNLLDLSNQNGVKKFVFGSSSSVYGNTSEVPFVETQDVDHPISPYAATKRMGEIICYTYQHLFDIQIICARIFGPIFGPLQRPYGMAAQRFIRQVDQNIPITVYGDGTMERDSTYIDDEVNGLIMCIDADIDFDILNIGTGSPVSVNEMAELTLKHMGKGKIDHIDKPATEVKITYADTSKAEEVLGYKAEIEYEEGVKRQIEIYKMMPDWYRALKI